MKKLIILTVLLLSSICFYGQKKTVSGTSSTVKTTFAPSVPKPTAPPVLKIFDIKFTDSDNNNMIDAEESCYIRFTISNTGSGSAYQIIPTVKEKNGIRFLNVEGEKTIREMKPGSTESLTFTLKAGREIASGQATFDISAIEGNGFDAQTQQLKVSTKEFTPPNPVIADAIFSTKTGGNISRGELITLQVLVQNQGQRTANNVELNFDLPANVIDAEGKNFKVGNLAPGEKKIFEFPFMVNNRYVGESVNITTNLTESYGKYGQKKTHNLQMNSYVGKTTVMVIEGNQKEQVIQSGSLRSDVAMNIPTTNFKNNKTFALIIANENYRRESRVEFAKNDGDIFRMYCIQTLGLPENNVHFVIDATLNDMRGDINWLNNVANAFNGEANIIFYYAGHGIPDESSKTAYLLPADGYGSDVQTCYQLEDLYQKLGKMPAKSVTVFMDACFSGSQRSGEMLASARGVAIRVAQGAPIGNMVVFSAAQGDETAFPYLEKGHGMFTYFLLKKLQETKGDVTLGELGDYIITNVRQQSIVINKKIQTPTVIPATNMSEKWRGMKLK